MTYASYDLHLHTCWSYDAVAPVEYYFRRARELKLRYIAIAEHFTMDSLPEILEVAEKYPDVRFIPAAELTATNSLGAMDMVCLGLPTKIPPYLAEVFDLFRQWQRDYSNATALAMEKLGKDYSLETRMRLLRSYRPEHVLKSQGLTNLQNGIRRKYFLEQGLIERDDQYGELQERLRELAEFPSYPTASEVLPAVRQAGGIVILAHPTHYFQRDNLTRMDTLREELALDGIECAHDMIPPELTPFYREYCVKHGLLSSAGSDSHADPADNPHGIGVQHEMARHIGEDAWLEEILDRLGLEQ
jgi:predicted metal-dependent phosphoesterase TrpH